MTVLVTGALGFIGYHVARRLLDDGHEVVGVDDLSAKDTSLHRARGEQLAGPRFQSIHADLADEAVCTALFDEARPKRVVHLAAQTGVRVGHAPTSAYVKSNLVAFANVLDHSRRHGVEHFVYASSSSVYGASSAEVFRETDPADAPLSFYGATKRSNELLAHATAGAFGTPCTGLRYFTVYGPWGRPDMAVFGFTQAIVAGRTIDLFGDGTPRRAFTFVDDAARCTVKVLDRPPTITRSFDASTSTGIPTSSTTPHRVLNVGHDTAIPITHLVSLLEQAIGRRAITSLSPMQSGDMITTCADSTQLRAVIADAPTTSAEVGIPAFVAWYRSRFGG